MQYYATTAGFKHTRTLLLVSGGLLLALPLSASAQEVAGRVISTVGEVVALREEDSERVLGRGDEVYVGDQLITAENGRAQIRFIDDGLVDLRPDSAFEVVEYQEADDQQSGSAAMEFTAGALRTITGRIGSRPEDDYDMSTDIASIGIRGTDYSLQLCDINCAENNQPEGLYGRVDDGVVAITNQAGTTEFSQNQYFLVESEDLMPQLLTTPPQNILDGSEDGETAEENSDDDTDDDAAPAELAETDDNGDDDTPAEAEVPVDTEFVAADTNPIVTDGNTGPVTVNSASVGISYTSDGDLFGGMIRQGDNLFGGFTTNADNEVTTASFPDGWSVTSTDNASTNFFNEWESSGGDANVYWGTWSQHSNDGVTGFKPNGEPFNSPEFRFVYSTDVTTPTQLAELTGSIDYSWYDMAVISSNGNFWNLQALDMTVDFDNTSVSEFNLAINDGTSFVTSNMSDISIDRLLLLDFDLEGEWVSEESGEGSINGNFNGQLIGETAEGLIFSFDVDRLSDADQQVLESLLGIGIMVDDEGRAFQ